VALEEGFLSLVGKGHNKGHPAKAQTQAEELDQGFQPTQDGYIFPPVALGIAAGAEL